MYVEQGLLHEGKRFSWQEMLERHRNLLVTAGPGLGKSSLLRRIAHVLTGPSVPVRVHARSFVRGRPMAEAIREGASAELTYRLLRELPVDMFEAAPPGGLSWLVLVDGLDELHDAQERETALRVIADGTRHEFFRFVIASRPLRDVDLGEVERRFTRYELQPLGIVALEEFGEKWFAKRDVRHAAELSRRLCAHVRNSHLLGWADRPLYALMLCELLANDPYRQLPRNRVVVYEHYVNKVVLTRGSAEDRRTNQLVVFLLERIAYDNLVDGFLIDVLDWASELVVGTALEPAAGPEDVQRRELHDLLCSTDLVVSTGDGVEFAHRTFEEYFAARRLVRMLEGLNDRERQLRLQELMTGLAESYEYSSFYLEEYLYEFTVLPQFLVGVWAARGHEPDALVAALVRAKPSSCWLLIKQLSAEDIELGPETISSLVAITVDPNVDAEDHLRAGFALAELNFDLAVDVLLAIATDVDFADATRVEVMQFLTNNDRAAAGALHRLMWDSDLGGLDFPHRADANELLLGLALDETEKHEGLWRIVGNGRLDDTTRARAGAIAVDAEGTAAYRRLKSVLPLDRLPVSLAEAATQGCHEAVSVLWRMVDDGELSQTIRDLAAEELEYLPF
ncbi:signal transduction protein [Lentzea sp. NPDC006480]|uniref:NACHT domain-containing protein n=1 Tax=Lentzea sp. NPDC006480 TaxID=3157176 RepID=UPI0033A78DD4